MPYTKKLFYADAYATEFCATVLSCNAVNGRFAVELDQTLFYPEGGGQPADKGALGGACVLDVHEKDGTVLHMLTAPLEVGEAVVGNIDWQRRFDHMQQHTGEHMISGIIKGLYGGENVGFHLGDACVTVDYDVSLTAEEVARVEGYANDAVLANLAVSVQWPDADTLSAMSYRSKKALSGAVRIVSIAREVDSCACCGTHVATTAAVGAIKIISSQSYKGGTRLSLLCGKRAMADYMDKHEANAAICRLLSVKPAETVQGVQRVLCENAALCEKLFAAENRYFALAAARYAETMPTPIFEDALSPDSLRRFAMLCNQTSGKLAAVFSACQQAPANSSATQSETLAAETVFQYAICQENGQLRAFGKAMNAALNGRGGGSDALVQGSVTASRAAIEAFFAQMASSTSSL